MDISRRALVKMLYKLVEYLYTEKTNAKVNCKNWKVTKGRVRYEIDIVDSHNKCSIVFDTEEV